MEERGAQDTALYTRLFREVKKKMDAGTAKPCISVLLWEHGPSPELTETEMAYFTAMPFAAGTTTVRQRGVLWQAVRLTLRQRRPLDLSNCSPV